MVIGLTTSRCHQKGVPHRALVLSTRLLLCCCCWMGAGPATVAAAATAATATAGSEAAFSVSDAVCVHGKDERETSFAWVQVRCVYLGG